MLYPNVYPENKRRVRATNNNSSLSLNSSIINLEKEVSRLNQEIVDLKLALAQIIDVLSNFSFTPNPVPPTEPVVEPEEPTIPVEPEPPVEEPTEPSEPNKPIKEIPEIEVTEEFYTAINGILWLLN